ncbi:hypothetical protein PPSIR1_09236 [Plesiocystis pacifica SIR-1]|uniref:Tetratricopeptide repeat protein n=1 Tax=Plesiocystis pacifica SIR-1 TaxID=391625 RepID=A6G776_9BACT|nr:hypothetical protein [Plesiocystis pacifica]EDM78352.1 hypothetical protein PPSIR1_09236 [Plesiocystis pacifica SIR-1]
MDRLAMLEQIAKTKLDDPFPQYGLAMEYKKLGRLAEARQAFAALVERHASYIPAYLMYGNLLEAVAAAGEDEGAKAEAASMYERGIEVASAAMDEHAVSELRAARDALG